MNFWIGLILATIFLFATIVIFATKFLFPYHRIVALVVYTIGWIPFLYSISLRKKWVMQHNDTTMSFFQVFWIHIIFGVIMLLSLYIFLAIFPATKSIFIGLDDKKILQRLKEDKTVILYLNDRLSGNLTNANEQKIFSVDFNDVTREEKQKLTDFWISYLEILVELDLLKERYKTFYQLNAVTKKDLHRKAFENGYTAFLAQHYYALQLTKKVRGRDIVTFLNQDFPTQGIEKGTFNMLQKGITDADELLCLNAGRVYHSLIQENNSDLSDLIDLYLQTVDKSLDSYTHLIAKKPLNFLERNSFKLWFPIQKQASIQISYVRTASRDYHINAKLINQYKKTFVPGDILLERREWHATNVGIPGFWTHSALYIGTLNKLSTHFKDIPELKGLSFKEYLKENFPDAYETLKSIDENDYKYAVIESKRPGVILTSLEFTANADSLAVLRVKNINRSDHFKIVTQALSHLGKPYDFDFDFVTDDTLVCSELVYKAYQDITQFNITPEKFNGRPIVSPNQFAKKFDHEYDKNDSELDLVLFLDGNEKKKAVIEKDAIVFRETWKRPKWHITKDLIDLK